MAKGRQKEDVLTDLYRDQALPMVYLAMSMGCSQQDAEDAVHQVFERLIKIEAKLEKMTVRDRISYLIVSVRNAARDVGRKKSNIPSPLETVQEMTIKERGEDEERLISEIAELPSDLGAALHVRFCLGYAVEESAKLLGWSRRTLLRKQERRGSY